MSVELLGKVYCLSEGQTAPASIYLKIIPSIYVQDHFDDFEVILNRSLSVGMEERYKVVLRQTDRLERAALPGN